MFVEESELEAAPTVTEEGDAGMSATELEAEVVEESPAATPETAEEQEAEEPIQESKAEATAEPLAAASDAEEEQEPGELEVPVESSEPQDSSARLRARRS